MYPRPRFRVRCSARLKRERQQAVGSLADAVGDVPIWQGLPAKNAVTGDDLPGVLTGHCGRGAAEPGARSAHSLTLARLSTKRPRCLSPVGILRCR